MDAFQEKAEALPKNAPPPESIRLLPLDGLLDQIQVKKSATLVATPVSVE